MLPDVGFHIFRANVTDFDGLFVKDFVVLVGAGIVLLDERDKDLTDVRLDAFC